MLQRLYVHNYRCFENFEFKPLQSNSILLLGKNGSGKSTLLKVFRLFQNIGRGTNRVAELISPIDLTLGRTDVPVSFSMDVLIKNRHFRYSLSLELPEGFRELRVKEEKLELDGKVIFSRNQALVNITRISGSDSQFSMDWHMIALPIIHEPSSTSTLSMFQQWLNDMILLAPLPSLITGDAETESLSPKLDGRNFADWLSGLLARYPAAYASISTHLKETMPDLMDFRFERVGKDSKILNVRFKSDTAQHELPFDALSDGEKCFFLCAVVLAAQENYGPLFAFWDEPDNYLSLSEVGHFVVSLRKGFNKSGQIIMTSHNEEAIRRFSNENTWVLGRKSHVEPTVIRLLEDMTPSEDIIESLIRGDLEP